jgi:addiction module RelE/StbE family toxin
VKPIQFSPEAKKRLKEIQIKDIKLSKRIEKQLELFLQNPKLKSLRIHKISLEVKNSWSISITKNFRMIYTETEDEYYFYKIGTHDEVYRK